MHLVMFDIDGTLVKSCDFDTDCFVQAVRKVLDVHVDTDWSKYTNITDSGILDEIISTHTIKGNSEQIHHRVKLKFIEYLREYLAKNKVKQIEGASYFLNLLKKRKDIILSIATGGWKESAMLKLQSAGIDCSGIFIASSSDHYERTKIMKIAENNLSNNLYVSRTYFGDASWDKRATEKLGYNFILVGNKIKHHQQIKNFVDANEVFSYIGL